MTRATVEARAYRLWRRRERRYWPGFIVPADFRNPTAIQFTGQDVALHDLARELRRALFDPLLRVLSKLLAALSASEETA